MQPELKGAIVCGTVLPSPSGEGIEGGELYRATFSLQMGTTPTACPSVPSPGRGAECRASGYLVRASRGNRHAA